MYEKCTKKQQKILIKSQVPEKVKKYKNTNSKFYFLNVFIQIECSAWKRLL